MARESPGLVILVRDRFGEVDVEDVTTGDGTTTTGILRGITGGDVGIEGTSRGWLGVVVGRVCNGSGRRRAEVFTDPRFS